MQESAAISYLPSPWEIAPTGHSPAQAPQLTQVSVITYAMIKYLLFIFAFVYIVNYIRKLFKKNFMHFLSKNGIEVLIEKINFAEGFTGFGLASGRKIYYSKDHLRGKILLIAGGTGKTSAAEAKRTEGEFR